MTKEPQPPRRSSKDIVAVQVCENKGHNIMFYDLLSDHVMCCQCGMTLREIREVR